MLVQENGKEGTAEVLKGWLANKDRDPQEREGDIGSGSGSGSGGGGKSSSSGALDCL